MEKQMGNRHYGKLVVMVGLHFIVMYILMYSMVNIFDNVFHNFNQFYMAGLMTASMVIIEVPMMHAMYHNKKLNIIIVSIGTAALILFYIFIREQTAVADKQFLKSMIPHHAGAILMCEQASITDPEIKKLCETIISSQQSEIDPMKRILNRLEE